MIQGIFYARFFPQQGTKIVAQSPPGCIVPEPDATSRQPLVDFDVLQEYIIPRKAFFNRYVTVTDPSGKYVVLCFPVSISNPKYHRNEFLFNFGLVVESCLLLPLDDGYGAGDGGRGDGLDQIPYERVVRRLAATFQEMELQSEYLSRDPGVGVGVEQSQTASPSMKKHNDQTAAKDAVRRPIASLLEIIKEDLNNYGECMIPVDDANTINMKLFPHHPNPPAVHGWHVPVPKLKLADIIDSTWDLTLQRLIPHIDGVSDVRRIAHNADVSLDLAQLAFRHLLYYDTILLLDMFFFSAIYAPRPGGMRSFVANEGGVVDECRNYVCIGPEPRGVMSAAGTGTPSSLGSSKAEASSLGADRDDDDNGGGTSTSSASRRTAVSNYHLIKLMTTFCTGKSVAEWLKQHMDTGFNVLHYVDVRRLVQFGIIKGILYRVHKYVVSKQYLTSLATGQVKIDGPSEKGKDTQKEKDPEEEDDESWQKYMDGIHSFDRIITEQNMTDGEIMDKLKTIGGPTGDLSILYK